MKKIDNDSSSSELAVGSQTAGRKLSKSRIVLIVVMMVAALFVIGGLGYAIYSQYQYHQSANHVDPDPEAFKYDYSDEERERRLEELMSESADNFNSEQELNLYYEETTRLLALEGRCQDYEAKVDEFASKSRIDPALYLDVARCYEQQDGDSGQIIQAVDKAEKQLDNVEFEDDREHFQDRIRFYRGRDA